MMLSQLSSINYQSTSNHQTHSLKNRHIAHNIDFDNIMIGDSDSDYLEFNQIKQRTDRDSSVRE